jgi:hypothetical protein
LARLGFTRFDYLSYVFGILATVFVIMSRDARGPLLFFVEAFAALICLVFLATFVANIFTHQLSRSEARICVYHIACNLLPTIHLLSRLKETPWSQFAG